MIDKAFLIVLGWALCATVISCFTIWLLFKKPTTENHIKSQKQKIKRNRGSNSSNDMDIKQEPETREKRKKQRKNGIFKRIFIKKRKHD